MSLATSRKGGRKSKHREKSVFELLGEVAKLTEKAMHNLLCHEIGGYA